MKRSLFALILGLAAAAPAAAWMLEIPMEDLVRTSDAVVRAHVVDRHSRWLEDPHIIVTDVTLDVRESWLGRIPPGTRITLQVHGGEVGDIGMREEHQPVFAADEDVVLFLTGAAGARLQVNSVEQGKYSVLDGEAVGSRMQRLSLASLKATVNHLAPQGRR